MELVIGNIVEGKVTTITKFGAFVSLPEGKSGMIHISEISNNYVTEIRDFLKENQSVNVRILNIDENGRIGLSLKESRENAAQSERPKRKFNSVPEEFSAPKDKDKVLAMSFEDKLSRFKQDSDQRITDLRRSLESKKGALGKKSSSYSKY